MSNGIDPFGGIDWGASPTYEYPYAYDPLVMTSVLAPPASPIYTQPAIAPTPTLAESAGQSPGFNVQDFFKGVTPILSAGVGAATQSFVSGFFGVKSDPTAASRTVTASRPPAQFLSQSLGVGQYMAPLLVFVGAFILAIFLFRR